MYLPNSTQDLRPPRSRIPPSAGRRRAWGMESTTVSSFLNTSRQLTHSLGYAPGSAWAGPEPWSRSRSRSSSSQRRRRRRQGRPRMKERHHGRQRRQRQRRRPRGRTRRRTKSEDEGEVGAGGAGGRPSVLPGTCTPLPADKHTTHHAPRRAPSSSPSSAPSTHARAWCSSDEPGPASLRTRARARVPACCSDG